MHSIHLNKVDDNGADHTNALEKIKTHVNAGGGNYARVVVAKDGVLENRSWKITSVGSYLVNGTVTYYGFSVGNSEQFSPDTNIQGAGSYSTLSTSVSDNTAIRVWVWLSNNANYYTNTTTTYNTSTLKTISTSKSTLLQNTTRSTSRTTSTTTNYNTSTITKFNTSRTTIFNTSRTTQWYTVFNTTTTFETSTNTVVFHNTTTFYNTSRSTFTADGGGGCSRGCI